MLGVFCARFPPREASLYLKTWSPERINCPVPPHPLSFLPYARFLPRITNHRRLTQGTPHRLRAQARFRGPAAEWALDTNAAPRVPPSAHPGVRRQFAEARAASGMHAGKFPLIRSIARQRVQADWA